LAADKMTDKSLDELWSRLKDSGSQCTSLLKKHLTPQVFEKYRNTMTSYGGTIRDCMASGEFRCINLLVLSENVQKVFMTLNTFKHHLDIKI
jgi:hypothetical protein